MKILTGLFPDSHKTPVNMVNSPRCEQDTPQDPLNMSLFVDVFSQVSVSATATFELEGSKRRVMYPQAEIRIVYTTTPAFRIMLHIPWLWV